MKKPLLIFLFIVFYAGYLVFTKLLFGDDNLVLIKGKLPKYSNLAHTINFKENNIDVACLTFKLNGDDRLYKLTADITNAANGPRLFDGVAQALKEANEIEVYITKSQLGSTIVKVYQIRTDDKEVFNLIKKPANNSRLYLLLLLLLLLFSSAYYWLICLSVPKKSPVANISVRYRARMSRHYGF
jgi:hypothetical protein